MSIIFNIQRYSLHDGSGIRSTIFLKGCPFTCPWCSNPESLLSTPQCLIHSTLCMKCSSHSPFACTKEASECPTNAKEVVGKYWSDKQIIEEVLKDEVFYQTSQGGVTFSGGEPLLQIDAVLSLAKQLKQRKIHTAIETTLAVPNIDIVSLVQYIDEFLVDFKIFDPIVAKEVLHLDIAIFKSNVEKVIQHGGTIIARIPLVPGYIATKDNIRMILDYSKTIAIKEVHLLPFHKLASNKYLGLQKKYLFEDIPVLSTQELQEYVDLFFKEGFTVQLKG